MPEPTPATPAVSPEAAMAAIAQMRAELRELDKVADRAGKERHILDKNFKLRRKIAELEAENGRLVAAKPKDGSIVLSSEDRTEYEAFKKLNLKAADLATLVKEHGELKTKDAERSAEELFVDAADALGFENLPLFVRTMTREGLHLEFKDVQVRDEDSGKMVTVKVPMVRPKADDKAALVPLENYLEEELGTEFVAVLQSEPPGEGDEGDDEFESRASGERGDGESFTRRASRMGEGDAAARRVAANAAARERRGDGVPIPVTRNARPSRGTSRTEKAEREAFEEKAKSPMYAGL